ncbi:MAG: ester cyclase, partial [Mangrovicoccus sp.]
MSDNSEFDFERRDPHGFLENSAEAIWGDRNLAAIHKYFATDMVSRSPMRVFENRESLINEAMSDLAEFPDLQMLSEDVINCDTGLEKALDPGLFSAQRMTLKASHIGDGQYGQATGKAVQFRVMSDRWYSSEKLYDEWLVRDTAAILRQLDQQPEDWARRILQDMGPEAVAPLTPDRDIEGPYGGLRSGAAWGDELAALLKQLMAGEIG